MPILLSPGSEERPFLRFEAENISNYTALLLSRDGKTLYVGAREALFALNSSVSFLPDGGYQEVRCCPALAAVGRGWQRGGWAGRLTFWVRGEETQHLLHVHLHVHLPPFSRSSAAVECRCGQETAVQLQGQRPAGEPGLQAAWPGGGMVGDRPGPRAEAEGGSSCGGEGVGF